MQTHRSLAVLVTDQGRFRTRPNGRVDWATQITGEEPGTSPASLRIVPIALAADRLFRERSSRPRARSRERWIGYWRVDGRYGKRWMSWGYNRPASAAIPD